MNINGNFLYNLSTGEIIAKKKTDGDNGTVVDINGENQGGEYVLLDGVQATDNYGTVDMLGIDKIVDLFVHGNLTVEELWNGICNNAHNYSLKKEGDLIVVEFDYIKGDTQKHYKIHCNADAAASQTDDIVVEDISNSIYTENQMS